jgi:hypothetical protein
VVEHVRAINEEHDLVGLEAVDGKLMRVAGAGRADLAGVDLIGAAVGDAGLEQEHLLEVAGAESELLDFRVVDDAGVGVVFDVGPLLVGGDGDLSGCAGDDVDVLGKLVADVEDDVDELCLLEAGGVDGDLIGPDLK